MIEQQKLAFNSKNKFAVKLVKRARAPLAALPALFDGDENSDQLLLVKGAPVCRTISLHARLKRS